MSEMDSKLVATRNQTHNVPRELAAQAPVRETRDPPSFSLRDHSWRQLVASSAEHFPRAAAPSVLQQVVLSKIALPYNSDIACDVILAGVAMLIEHHRNSSHPEKLLEDMAAFVTSIAKQDGQLLVS